MTIKNQKTLLMFAFIVLVLVSLACFLFAYVCYVAAPVGIHDAEIHSKLGDDSLQFVSSVMRSQILQVSRLLGILVLLWAAFAALALFLWNRLHQKCLQHEKATT